MKARMQALAAIPQVGNLNNARNGFFSFLNDLRALSEWLYRHAPPHFQRPQGMQVNGEQVTWSLWIDQST